jgi:hypothetical protein
MYSKGDLINEDQFCLAMDLADLEDKPESPFTIYERAFNTIVKDGGNDMFIEGNLIIKDFVKLN